MNDTRMKLAQHILSLTEFQKEKVVPNPLGMYYPDTNLSMKYNLEPAIEPTITRGFAEKMIEYVLTCTENELLEVMRNGK